MTSRFSKSRKSITVFGLAAISITTMLAIGCAPGNPRNRQPISGRVTLADQPLDQGAIEFNPQDKQDGIQSGAPIVDGAYDIPTLKGLPPGKYLVRIFSASETEVDSSEPEQSKKMGSPVRPAKERIPPTFNLESNLIVEVTNNGRQRFDFDIPP